MKDLSAVAAATFARNYQLHLKHLTLKGLQPKTVEAYSSLETGHPQSSLETGHPQSRQCCLLSIVNRHRMALVFCCCARGGLLG